jgi:hypothetical protein
VVEYLPSKYEVLSSNPSTTPYAGLLHLPASLFWEGENLNGLSPVVAALLTDVNVWVSGNDNQVLCQSQRVKEGSQQLCYEFSAQWKSQ